MDGGGRDKLAPGGKLGRNRHADRLRSLDAQILRIDGKPVRMTAKQPGIEARGTIAARLIAGDVGIRGQFDAGEQRTGGGEERTAEFGIRRLLRQFGTVGSQ